MAYCEVNCIASRVGASSSKTRVDQTSSSTAMLSSQVKAWCLCNPNNARINLDRVNGLAFMIIQFGVQLLPLLAPRVKRSKDFFQSFFNEQVDEGLHFQHVCWPVRGDAGSTALVVGSRVRYESMWDEKRGSRKAQRVAMEETNVPPESNAEAGMNCEATMSNREFSSFFTDDRDRLCCSDIAPNRKNSP